MEGPLLITDSSQSEACSPSKSQGTVVRRISYQYSLFKVIVKEMQKFYLSCRFYNSCLVDKMYRIFITRSEIK